jgi:Family of unknown function (DUF5752)
MNSIFVFKQCITILKATGKKARNLRELRASLASVSPQSLFHHTHQYLLKGHILEYTNDFAHWAGESLEERALAEHLSNIDPYDYVDIERLRTELIKQLDEYLERFPEPRDAMSGDEFFFNETIMLVFPAGVRVRNLAEFLMAIRYADTSSLYYHFYDARQRLGEAADDFSTWFESALGKSELAKRIRAIDPFMHSLEGIRELISRAVEEEVQHDMEAAGVTP